MSKIAVIGNTYAGSPIGKIEDAGTLVMGGGVDSYWVNSPEMKAINKSISDEDKIHKDIYTADQNEFIDEFGFKSVEFGNWLNQPERYYFLYNSAVSFKHLSDLFNIPHYLIGFNDKLSVAFGARGVSSAMAHFEKLPNIIINLTKEKGHHYLAHEYGHAIDNLLGFYIGKDQNSYISGGRSNRTLVDDELSLSPNYFIRKFEQLFKVLYFNEDGTKTDFLKRIKSHKQADYLTRRTEVFARTFEVYVANKLDRAEIKNTFLVKRSNLNASYPVELSSKIMPIMDSIILNAYKVFADRSLQEKMAQEKNNGFLGAVEVLSQNGKKLEFNGFTPVYNQLASYDHLIKDLSNKDKDKTVARGGLNETIPVIKKVINNYRYQLVPLAHHLKATTVQQSAFNVWHFIKKNIRYDFDLAGKEEIRTPARAWKDRFKRSDCEDYAIFASSLLINMGYSPTLRIVAFNNKENYQHIYVTVNGIAIDAVLNTFNKEPDNITKVMDIQVLSGLGATEQIDVVSQKLMNSQSQLIKQGRGTKCKNKRAAINKELRKIRYMLFIRGTEERNEILPVMAQISDITGDGKFIFKGDADMVAIADYLTHATALREKGISGLGANDFTEALRKFQIQNLKRNKAAILKAIDSGELKQEKATKMLIEIDLFLAKNGGLAGPMDAAIAAAKAAAIAKTAEQKGISEAAAEKEVNAIVANAVEKARQEKEDKNFFQKAGSFVKNTVSSVGSGIKTAVKKVGEVIVKYNPLSIAARNAYLGLLRLNFRGWAEDYALGYTTPQRLQQKGYSAADIQTIAQRKNKLEDFWKSVGGSTDSLRKAIVASKSSKQAMSGLGVDPVTATAAAVATATPIIYKVADIVEKYKLAKQKVTNIKDKVVGAKNTLTDLKSAASGGIKNFLPGGSAASVNPTPQQQAVKNKEEQDFINNDLYNDFENNTDEDNGGSGEKSNTIWWVLGLSVAAVGGIALMKR